MGSEEVMLGKLIPVAEVNVVRMAIPGEDLKTDELLYPAIHLARDILELEKRQGGDHGEDALIRLGARVVLAALNNAGLLRKVDKTTFIEAVTALEETMHIPRGIGA